MIEFQWDALKSEELKRTRGVSFEEIIHERLVGIMAHPARIHQNILLFERQDYIWMVPCVAHDRGIFLKTLYASRKYTKRWKRGELT